MITRKRGRHSGNSVGAMCSSPTQECDQTLHVESESGIHTQTSPESDTNDWGLDDLFSTDINWAFDNDLLSPFADVGVQDLNTEDKMDQASNVSISHKRGSTERQKLQDLSGRIINKNAMAARMNRLKKKQYLSGLEQRVGSLTSENRLLKQENSNLNKRVEELENETRSPTRMTMIMPCHERE
ncbi:uncharacterized protein crebzf [Electrophorus electricus]|uniref:uncharacterized protein crebzf n=1 Tax=Electrophorus electricus TaxID=8005 RepID=UPI0015CFDF41|nr:uncharacterized protein crebzf [Electrophorus electricus]